MPASWSPRVWLSVVLGIFLQPFVFLYVNRPGLFWLYLVASLVCAGVDWYFGLATTRRSHGAGIVAPGCRSGFTCC